MTLWKAFWQAVSMYTVLPVPGLRWDSRADRHMLACFPLVGLLVGTVWYGGSWLMLRLGAPALLAAAITSLLPFLFTGFLHLDGYMDVCDAVLSRRDRDRRLEILKDPHTGAFAVLSALSLFLLQFAASDALLKKPGILPCLLFLPVISRGVSVFCLMSLPTLPQSGMAKWLKQDTSLLHRIFILLVSLAAAVGIILVSPLAGAASALFAAATGCLAGFAAYRQFGGVSGDTCGCSLVFSELSGLLLLAVL